MLDLILRGAAIGVMLTTAASLVLSRRGSADYSVAAFGAMIACYLIVSAPASAGLAQSIRVALTIGALLAPLALCWMALELLTDTPSSHWPVLLLGGLTVLAGATALLWPQTGLVRTGLAVALYGSLIWLAVSTDRDDLVAKRRKFRRGFLIVLGLVGVLVTGIEALNLDTELPRMAFLAQSGGFLCLSLAFALWVLRPHEDPTRPQSPVPEQARHPDVVARLTAAMANGAWQREGLTIGELAAELNVPQHLLRSTINGDLGFRNFSTFVNGHRIEAAKRMLDDPANSRTTILEIAHDVGFGSLGPFNKAFRAQAGQTPRAYRNRLKTKEAG